MLFHVAALALLSSVASAQTIVDIVVNSTDHNTLEAAVIAAPAVATVLSDEEGSYTVFAPTDAAFEEVDSAFLQQLLTEEWSSHLVCLLTSHVIGSEVRSTDLPTTPTQVTTLSGYNVTVLLDGEEASVDEIPVIAADIEASNGVVHVIDGRPILPTCVTDTIVDIASSIDDFTTLVSLVRAAGLVDTLSGDGPFTVFAPTNDAFVKIPPSIVEALMEDTEALASVLTYHVIPSNVYGDIMGTAVVETVQGGNLTATAMDGSIMLNGDAASVTTADVLARNGVIHVIDSVLLPPDFVDPRPSNVEIVVGSPNHNTLETAVTTVPGLVDTLNGIDSYTLFAPTDEAFGAIDQDYLGMLLMPEWTRHLTCILAEHVVPGPAVLSGSIMDGMAAQTLGDMIEFGVDEQGITVEDIVISTPDIVTRDGVVHSIDGVILPECITQTIYDVASADSFSTLKSLVDLAGLNETLQTMVGLTVFAPTNDAFAKVDSATLDFLTNNVTALTDVLLFHVLGGVRALPDDLLAEGDVETLQGTTASFVTINDMSYVNGIEIDDEEVLAGNGVVYVIEDVLIPLAEGETVAPVTPPTTDSPVMAPPVMAPVAAVPPPPTSAPVDVIDPPTMAESSSMTRTVVVAAIAVGAVFLC